MKDIRRKYNPMVNLSNFTSNKKKIRWSCSLSLQLNLLQKFVAKICPKFNYVGPKKI